VIIRRLVRFIDERLGTTRFARRALNKAFPDHWSFMLGEIALYAFVILVLTGTFLAFFYNPSGRQVTYTGSYAPLRHVRMTLAYRSTLRLSFDVRAGLVMRQTHHWAALVFIGSIVAHVARVFFTGAFRRPREINWIVGLTLLVLAMFNGFTGYSLPDDLLSGTGLRIAYSIILSVPLVGEWAAFLVFGGQFPSEDILSRLFVLHIFLVPALISGLLAAHLAILWRQKHTQFAGPGRTERNVVGSRLWPTYAVKSVGLFALIVAVLAGLGGLVQINPVWLYGPFQPAAVTTAAQPDWYVGWLEGALRLAPPWEAHVFGGTISEVFWPGVLLPSVVFGLLYLWPFLERRMTGDGAEHHLLDRPRDRPVRTGIGVGALTFFAVLLVAGGQDVVANELGLSVVDVTHALQVLVWVLPLITGLLAWKWCRDLRAGEPGGGPATASEPAPRAPAMPASGALRHLATGAGTLGRAVGGAVAGLGAARHGLGRARRQA
jgi:ubiquinol-cytochrome c reductase cytochrome b subunit